MKGAQFAELLQRSLDELSAIAAKVIERASDGNGDKDEVDPQLLDASRAAAQRLTAALGTNDSSSAQQAAAKRGNVAWPRDMSAGYAKKAKAGR